ncbi:MAG: Fic family protein [Peptococcaceae bacterium]
MDYQILLQKKNNYQQGKNHIPELTMHSYERAFEIEYTHHSTAIEGNTLTLMETKLVLEDSISVGGKHLREIYEQVNHQKAFRYVKDCIAKQISLNESVVKEIHALLMENIIIGGVYRDINVYISGAQHIPPSHNEMYHQIQNFYADFNWKEQQLNQIEFAAWTHAEFVRIHPFTDGNGRTARLLMNYQLLSSGFVPISIAKEDKLHYFEALEEYAVNQNLQPFADMIAILEEKQLDRYLEMMEP